MSEYDNLLKSELIKQAQEMEETIGNCLEEIDQLKAENEELKKINKANAKSYEKFWYKLENYKQALKEIKEIAENGKRFAERYMITGEQKANVLTYANAILQKISEVEK